jgi:hypothetical protein
MSSSEAANEYLQPGDKRPDDDSSSSSDDEQNGGENSVFLLFVLRLR